MTIVSGDNKLTTLDPNRASVSASVAALSLMETKRIMLIGGRVGWVEAGAVRARAGLSSRYRYVC